MNRFSAQVVLGLAVAALMLPSQALGAPWGHAGAGARHVHVHLTARGRSGARATRATRATQTFREDDFLTPFPINPTGNMPLTYHDAFANIVNSVPATIQNRTVDSTQTNDIWQPVSSGSQLPEAAFCNAAGTVKYGATVWYSFFPHRNGRLHVSVAGNNFRPVVNLFSVNPATAIPTHNGAGDYSDSECQVATELTFRAEMDYTPYVAEGASYAIQIGGVAGGASIGSVGNFTLDVSYDPDTDRDGLFDSQDRCPSIRGPAALGGCVDSDGDGFVDPDDRCPRESSRGLVDRNHNGCPDFGAPGDAGPWRFANARGGVRFRYITIIGAPGTTLRVSCKPKRRCRSKRTSLRRSKKFFKRTFVRNGTTITFKLTRHNAITTVITLKVKGNNTGESVKCLPPSGGRARSCKSISTIR